MVTGQTAVSRIPEKAHNYHKDLVEKVSSMVGKRDIIAEIVDPRFKGEFGIQSVSKAVEIAMACISAVGTAGRLTIDEVVTGLNQCLAVEIAQNKDHERGEKGSIEFITINMETDESILLGR